MAYNTFLKDQTGKIVHESFGAHTRFDGWQAAADYVYSTYKAEDVTDTHDEDGDGECMFRIADGTELRFTFEVSKPWSR